MISKQSLKNVQNRLDLSNNAVLDLAASLRTDDVMVEPGLREDLYESGTLLKDHFEVKDLEYETKIDGEPATVIKPTVVCKNIDNFVQFVKQKRNVQSDVIVKYGADGGGTIFFCLLHRKFSAICNIIFQVNFSRFA